MTCNGNVINTKAGQLFEFHNYWFELNTLIL